MMARMEALPPVNQHTVSQVVLRSFTSRSSREPLRGRIAVLDRRSGHINYRFPKRCFTHANFISVDAHITEQVWGRIESRIPAVRTRLEGRGWPLDPQDEDVLRSIIALHWVRSSAVRLLHDRIAISKVAESKSRLLLEHPESVRRTLHKRTGILAAGPESLDWMLDRLLGELAVPRIEAEFRVRVQEYHDQAIEYFSRFRVQVAYAPRPSFVISDVPVITLNKEIGGLGPHQGVALMGLIRIEGVVAA
jgi:Protein of unknown function (DUF4238)